MRKTKPNKLLDANTAVESYLDNLLQEATEPAGQPKPKRNNQKVEKEDNVHVLETPLTKAKLIIDDDLFDGAKIEKVKSNENKQPISQVQQELPDAEEIVFPMQCLMFKVGGNLLALPLIQMGSVVPFEGRLTQLPYSPEYFKGLLKYREKNVRVADSTELLTGLKSANASKDFIPSHLLVFKREDWAISCDELLDVVTLNKEDVKWHSGDNNRLSLGTIKKSLALILNPESICKKLVNSDIEVSDEKLSN